MEDIRTDYGNVLEEIEHKLKGKNTGGRITTYIPELANIDPQKFGMHLYSIRGEHFHFGDSEEKFSIQSIAKVFTLTLAHIYAGKEIWNRIGVEPSGNAFNSLTELERDQGIPRNPLINAGALVTADILISNLDNPKKVLLDFVHHITGDSTISFDTKVMESEAKTGYRNIALVNYMKSLGNINNDVNEVLDFYFHQCSMAMTCRQLAKAFMLYANKGKILETGEQVIAIKEAKRISALMQTCGFYDEAGEFTYRVGLPGKSGVGGGIVAVRPGKYSVAVWSPPLNEKGNSMKGMAALEELTALTGTSIF